MFSLSACVLHSRGIAKSTLLEVVEAPQQPSKVNSGTSSYDLMCLNTSKLSSGYLSWMHQF